MDSSNDSLSNPKERKLSVTWIKENVVNRNKTSKTSEDPKKKKNLFNTLRNCFQNRKDRKVRLQTTSNVATNEVPSDSIQENEISNVQDPMRLLRLSEVDNYYGIPESNLSEDLENETQRSEEFTIKEIGSRNFSRELYELTRYGWYWGPISRLKAEEIMKDLPDGSFLVRDSLDDHYLLSVTFRCFGKTFHSRVEHNCGMFRLFDGKQYPSIGELIEQSMLVSRDAVYCFSRPRSPTQLALPVRLTQPYSRFMHVRSLQNLCRVVIRQCTRIDKIKDLPLPETLRLFLMDGYF